MSGAAIAHLSCHGFHNAASPFASFLTLDEPLTIRDVLGLDGQAPWLVNLSACQSGAQDWRAAEQSVSFPTAFLMGGAAHVYGTLWPIADDLAAAVNGFAYAEILAGVDPAAALREALLRVREDGCEHPLAWAAFTHIGSPT